MELRKNPLPDISYLNKRLRYDANSGKLYWNQCDWMSKHWNARFANKEAFTGLEAHGYKCGSIDNIRYKAHRVIWAIAHDKWPDGHIDHINHNKLDNRIENLRDIEPCENSKNKSLQINNKSGCTGVYWHKRDNKWAAQISVNRKRLHIGKFENLHDAIDARKIALKEYKYHSNHGI